MKCPECLELIHEPCDSTFNNDPGSKRAQVGQLTGEIYYCPDCGVFWLDDFLDNEIVVWNG